MKTTVKERPPPTGEGLTFEKVWAMFQETDRKFQETDKKFQETDRKFQETIQETREQMKEADKRLKKAEKLIMENGRQMGGLHQSFGQIAEHLVAPGIEKRFNKLGYHFDAIATRGMTIKDNNGKILAEIDIVLINGETIIAVEVKAKPAIKDIDHHIKRLEILRNSRSEIVGNRKILGAIAGAIYDTGVKEAVIDAGFFVIEQSGDTMKIDMPDGFKPREW